MKKTITVLGASGKNGSKITEMLLEGTPSKISSKKRLEMQKSSRGKEQK